MLMHWWIRQNVSKIIILEFSTKSSRHATRKKSFTNTVSQSRSFFCAPSKSKLTYRSSMKEVMGSW